jgi:hypothetical protein
LEGFSQERQVKRRQKSLQRFYLTGVTDKGYRYWLANYPGRPREVGGGKWRQRKQKKFSVRAEAEAFLAEKKRNGCVEAG